MVGYISAAPHDPFSILMDVKNDSALPITLLGIENFDELAPLSMQWTAVWTHFDPGGSVPDPTRFSAFKPFELQAGEWLTLYLVGRAGDCAVGPTLDLENIEGTATSFNRVKVAYSVLGMSSTAFVDLPFILVEPRTNPCGPPPPEDVATSSPNS